MQKLTTIIILTFLISYIFPNLLGQNDIDLTIKKVKYKDWSPILNNTLLQWEVWTGINELSVKSVPQNYKQDERGENKAPTGHGDSMGIFKVAKVDKDCFI